MPITRSRRVIVMLGALGLTGATLAMAAEQEADNQPDLRAGPPPASPDTESEAQAEISPENQAVLDQMAEVIGALDGDAERNGNNWQLSVEDRTMLVVTDPSAGRMRILTPIAEASALPEGAYERLMQANFDTALDARYAVANGLVWGAFIHPLDTLTVRDFASGILQTKSLADTFGTTFSSGSLNYGGGDSGAILEDQLQQLLEELEKREAV